MRMNSLPGIMRDRHDIVELVVCVFMGIFNHESCSRVRKDNSGTAQAFMVCTFAT